ncbi:hypothetical protein ILUMI_03681 [Ignelater luminosus]|uniref:CCHC-type domain-containing protein n=1 Tax=Ignelater luminosus TaxID=2038154 RepID=A0A8K0GFA1_IGNLU|nr:hypothetical protein ILUMI_03681 [Ignelater luminosus]
MVARIQRSSELLSTYFHGEYGLCRALNLTFSEAKEQILAGLSSKYIVQRLPANNHEDTHQLLHDILEFTRLNEYVMRPTRRESTEKKIKGGKTVQSKAENTCYKCGEKWHYKSECKKKAMKSIRLDKVTLYGYGCSSNPVKYIGVLEAPEEMNLVKLETVMLCVVLDHVQTVDVIKGRKFTKDPTIAY